MLRQQLEELHSQADFDGNAQAQRRAKKFLDELRFWSRVEDSILIQKYRIKWVKVGDDANAKFFFAATRARNAYNRIVLLNDDEGRQISGDQAIIDEILGFYKKLLGANADTLPGIDLNIVRVGKTLSFHAREELIREVAIEEIDNALDSIDNSKAPELIRGYSRAQMSPRCIMKVYIRKAYDLVEWSYLETLLYELGFPRLFVGWIMECVRSVSYAILVNGTPSMPFKAKKGIRAEASSISLMFKAFQKFSEASGLAANVEKSNIYLCGVQDDVARELSDIVHMNIGVLPFKYLGVPLTSKKLTYAQTEPLVEKMTSRAQIWMALMLSYAGRL
ncbi:uncharacterized protein LOC125498852 [Beta vulgaris subsp. vulgaris]|uniref:uncharacterized protein LOC125498852 n=1 Tax=Beta vulgaris subsp. vulgaris TaxID=3555 RepID=UPI00203667F8|nr:uncharacterized protein LOC125498852 [Beta vulgaris subsp. vulgaris]